MDVTDKPASPERSGRDWRDDGDAVAGVLYGFLLSAPLYAGLFLLARRLFSS